MRESWSPFILIVHLIQEIASPFNLTLFMPLGYGGNCTEGYLRVGTAKATRVGTVAFWFPRTCEYRGVALICGAQCWRVNRVWLGLVCFIHECSGLSYSPAWAGVVGCGHRSPAAWGWLYPSVSVCGFTYVHRLDLKSCPFLCVVVLCMLNCPLDSKGSNCSAVGVLQKPLPISDLKLSESGNLMLQDGICFPLQEQPHLSVTEYQD